MTLLDIIETYNLIKGNELDDIESIFQDIDIDNRLDKSILIGEILGECGAMRVIYETTPTFKYFSDNFFKKYKWNIEKLLDTLELKYNPLENKNWSWIETTDIDQKLATQEQKEENRSKSNTGTQQTDNTGTQEDVETIDESIVNTGTQTKANTGTQNNSEAIDRTKENTGTEGTVSSGTEDNTISAMNSSTYEPDTHKTTSGNSTRTDNLTETEGITKSGQRTDNLNELRTDNLNEAKTGENSNVRTDNLSEVRTDNLEETINANNDRNKNEDLTWDERDEHIERGSDGVTYQDLIEKERKIAQFSIYNWIVKKYASELFLLVY